MRRTHRIRVTPQIWLSRFSKFTSLSALLLIFAGGLVTSTGSGLAVPDWPNTYGYFMFFFPLDKMVGGIFYEHIHRLMASFVGLLTVFLAIWLWRVESRKWLKSLGIIALLLVIAQGLLGGITVLFLLPTAVSMTHGILAQTFFCLTVAIAYFLSKEWQGSVSRHDNPVSARLLRWSVVTTSLIFLQLILGALMRHTGSGLAVLDFPLANGHIIPAFNNDLLHSINDRRFELGLDPVILSQVVIHFIHRIGAVSVIVGIVGLSYHVLKDFRDRKRFLSLTVFLDVLLIIQIVLAAFVIWTAKSPAVTTFHVWAGALTLGTSLLLSLRCHRHLDFSRVRILRGDVQS